MNRAGPAGADDDEAPAGAGPTAADGDPAADREAAAEGDAGGTGTAAAGIGAGERGIVGVLLRAAGRLRSLGNRSERSRRLLLGVAVVAFVSMGAVAVRNYPDDVADDPNWLALALVGGIGAVVTIVLNAGEYRLQARMVARPATAVEALQVSVLGSAANLLPLPGSVIVRTQSLAGQVGYRAAIRTTTAAGATWFALTTLAAGCALVVTDLPIAGAVLAALGVAGMVGSALLVRRITPDWRTVFGALAAVEAGTVAVGALRLLGILLALGLDIEVGQAVALTLSGVVASATGIFPSGLGIREAAAAGIASLVSLPAAIGFVATAADRIAGLAVLALASTAILLTRKPAAPPSPLDR